MQVQSSNASTMFPEATPSTAGTTSTNSSTSSTDSTAAASTAALGDESTFLQLLVAQIQNQDPTQPIDSTTFLTQLAQFSSLEQLIGIHQDLNTANPSASTTSTTPTTSTSGS